MMSSKFGKKDVLSLQMQYKDSWPTSAPVEGFFSIAGNVYRPTAIL